MSQSFQQGLVNFSNGLILQQQEQQQSRRDKLRVQGFEPLPSLVAGEGEMPVYETGGMWSDMFNFPPGAASTSTDLLENQIPSNYRSQPPAPVEWYGNRHMGPLGDSKHHQQQPNTDNREVSLSHNHHQHISSINAADSAAAMQLFLMNPQHQSPPPPPSPTPQTQPPSSSSTTPLHLQQGFPPAFHTHHQIPPHQYTQLNTSKIGGAIESRGLSLTLSSSAEELRMGEDGVLYYDQGGAGTSSYHVKGLGSHHQQMQHIGLSRSSLGISSLLRNSKFLKDTQELLEEFCSVGRGHMKNKLGRHNSNPNPSQSCSFGVGGSSTSKELPCLSVADRIDCQRKKTKLLSMLDEVDRRYNDYCEQMQMVVNSFDSLMGFGAATPYTALAQKAMSRHFRCLKDAITAQLKQICELLGDKDGVATSGVTKGETPRLRLLEQSLRQQRAFHQMGMMDQEAWRPQRGLPERSVNILRAWLFEHFLHPYPSDADKHLLARQTGLSRNQVSNWFINARVRLWKPMVEDMYQQEAKEEDTAGDGDDHGHEENETNQHSQTSQTPTSSPPASTTSQPRGQENDSSLNAMNKQHLYFSEKQANKSNLTTTTATATVNPTTVMASNAATTTSNTPLGADISTVMLQSHVPGDDTCLHGSSIVAQPDYRTTHSMASTVVRFGTTMGDVSLTLGLRHAGNLPEKSRFSVRDFGDC